MATVPRDATLDHALLHRISDARRRSDALFDVVKSEAIFDRPIPERHRIIFYVGHLEAFDWNLLHENVFGLKSFHPEFDRLFAFGIDPVGGGLPTDRPSDWPDLATVRDYVRQIRAALDDKLSRTTLDSSELMRDGFPLPILLNVAVEHRLMHVETLAYMLHQLPIDRKVFQADPPNLSTPPVDRRMIEIPAGTATLGLSCRSEIFGWDNEFEVHSADVPSFQIDQYMVTNRQFLDFMNAEGTRLALSGATTTGTGRPLTTFLTPSSGNKPTTAGSIAPCLMKCVCRRLGPFMSAMPRRRRTHDGRASRFRRNRSGTARPTALLMVTSGLTRGAATLPTRAWEISISRIGTRRRSTPTRAGKAPSAWRACWAMDGSGRRLRSLHFQAFSPFRFIADIPQIFLMASTSS